MELVDQISHLLAPLLKNIYAQIGLLIAFATFHGYAGAWLAVRMLFRPREPIRLVGMTIFPQGMIPRHRDRLAAAIGKAVGEELVSPDTIIDKLTGSDLLKNKIRSVVDLYTSEVLATDQPSLIEALPRNIREPVLDTISALQLKLSEHIGQVLKSDESADAIRGFISRRVDEALAQRLSGIVDQEAFDRLIEFLSERLHSALAADPLESMVLDFVSKRLDDVVNSEMPLRGLFTDDAVELLKEKANDQIDPAIRQLSELAAAERTRSQIGALIKREVHDYYEGLPFFKKIFVSRDNLLGEVDDLVNESLPKRIEETLRGEFFASEAKSFINSSIDNALDRPLPEVIGRIAPEQLDRLKGQITRAVLSFLRSETTQRSIVDYCRDRLDKLRPHSLDAILQLLHSGAAVKVKSMLTRGLIDIIGSDDSAKMINEILAMQIDRLLSTPIGRLGDQFSVDKVQDASRSLTDAIVSAINSKLPEAIAEFDVQGLVREKIHGYPAEKLEALVLSVAKEHLHKIELFGALFGFVIGVLQSVQFYFYAR